MHLCACIPIVVHPKTFFHAVFYALKTTVLDVVSKHIFTSLEMSYHRLNGLSTLDVGMKVVYVIDRDLKLLISNRHLNINSKYPREAAFLFWDRSEDVETRSY